MQRPTFREAAFALLCGPAATPKRMLEGIVRAGVRTEVCELDLPNTGVGPDAPIEGVRPAQPPEMARRLIHRATTVLPF